MSLTGLGQRQPHQAVRRDFSSLHLTSQVLLASSDTFLMSRGTFYILLLVLTIYRDISRGSQPDRMKSCCPKDPKAKGQLASNILPSKTSWETHAYVPYSCNKVHLFRCQKQKNHSFTLTAKMLKLCCLFTSLFSLSQTILWESQLHTQNNDSQLSLLWQQPDHSPHLSQWPLSWREPSSIKGKPKPKVLHPHKECDDFTPLFMTNESQGFSEPPVNL